MGHCPDTKIVNMRHFGNKIGFFFLVFFSLLQGVSQTKSDLAPPRTDELRMPAVSGQFYPADPTELRTLLSGYFSDLPAQVHKPVRAVIVPHAGFVFSGEVAAAGFGMIEPGSDYKRVFILASSHRAHFKGASVYDRGNYQTPLGEVAVDLEIARKLTSGSGFFQYLPEAHRQEHSIEVQLPFLQYLFGENLRIVPVVIGDNSAGASLQIANSLRPYFTEENLFVISCDFSHYPDYESANLWDRITAEAILTNSPQHFLATMTDTADDHVRGLATRACGWTSVLTLMYLTQDQEGLAYDHVLYRNSGDSEYGDKSRVVGYHAIAVLAAEKNVTTTSAMSFTERDKELLLMLARRTIDAELSGNIWPDLQASDISSSLAVPCGAFVTLRLAGDLRGCIGTFVSDDPLHKVVQQMAAAAAFEDRRFMPLSKAELSHVEIEISVLTPLERIYSADEIQLGVHGIYIRKGDRAGTFLPQVAIEAGWSKDEFLGHCSRDKARIGWEGWKEAELYTFRAIVFHE